MAINIDEITAPTLMLNEDICKNNISRIYNKVKSLGIDFRPHFKTHQSKAISKWFREIGVDKITVSSVRMAEYFMQVGWNDITIAFPLNIREFDQVLAISKLIDLKVTISDYDTLLFLDKVLTIPMKIIIEIDVDFKRSGFDYNDKETFEKIFKVLQKNKKIQLVGISSHNGLVYRADSKDDVLRLHNRFLEKLGEMKAFFEFNGFPIRVCVGDTPSVSVANDFRGVDELRPGNFVFYDVMQVNLGSCTVDDIAICLAAPIVGVYPSRNQIVTYAGSIHLSKEFIVVDNLKIYGLCVEINPSGWANVFEGAFVSDLYQEHSVISFYDSNIKNLKVGDLIGILPVHSCLTAEAMRGYLSTNNFWLDHM